ncbi:hypothetical protein DIPPA_05965 [Diplonema papillatum]|nr:hypothetical protein DIPPA_05965 [Diplonema papillatum]|eukprot:gene1430-2200_t
MSAEMITLNLRYTVKEDKLEEFKQLAAERVKGFKGKTMRFCQGKLTAGKTLQVYTNGKQMIDDLAAVSEELTKKFSDLAKPTGLDIHAPESFVRESEDEVNEKLGFKTRGLLVRGACYSLADELEFKPRWFITRPGVYNGFQDDEAIGISVYFKVLDAPKMVTAMDACIANTKPEKGVLHYDFGQCKDEEDVVAAREAFKDPEAVEAHLKSIDATLKEYADAMQIVSFETHGPTEGLNKLRNLLDGVGAIYFSTD